MVAGTGIVGSSRGLVRVGGRLVGISGGRLIRGSGGDCRLFRSGVASRFCGRSSRAGRLVGCVGSIGGGIGSVLNGSRIGRLAGSGDGGRAGGSGRLGGSGSRTHAHKRAAIRGITVPVGHGITETLANGDEVIASVFGSSDHVESQLRNSGLVDVMGETDEGVGEGVGGGDGGIKVLGAANGAILPVKGVEIPVGDVVSVRVKRRDTGSVAVSIGRAEIGGDEAKDEIEGHLVLDDLVVELLSGCGVEISVRPRVRGDVVTGIEHVLEQARVVGGGLIDGRLAAVVGIDIKGCLGVVGSKNVEERSSVDVRTIVERQGHLAWNRAICDDGAVWDAAKLRARNGPCASARGSNGSITSHTRVILLAPRSSTVLGAGTAPPVLAATLSIRTHAAAGGGTTVTRDILLLHQNPGVMEITGSGRGHKPG